MSKTLTAERLKELLSYCPDTGIFTYRVKRGGMRAGSVAGSKQCAGYVQIYVDRTNYLAHRLAWLYMTGAMPERDIDHIDGVKANNAFANLRDVSEVINGHNRQRPNKNNESCGLIGVKRNRSRWAASITVNRVVRHLGTYDTPEQASVAYLAAKTAAGLNSPAA